MGIIITSKAKCKDCYKCIRYCPVKAIGINDEQAWVVDEKCILCGKCIEICPQHAKSTVSYIDEFINLLEKNNKIVVSIAPSYLAATSYSTPWKLIAGLKKLGVNSIEETSLGAEVISDKYHKLFKEELDLPVISSDCPTVVNLIKKYYPDLINSLASFISPMMTHAKMIKGAQGEDTKVVFIGPCYSKKDEPDWNNNENMVDLVLDFTEIIDYFQSIGLNPEDLEDQYPDKVSSRAKLYPLETGVLKTAKIKNEIGEVISVSGIDEIMELFNDMVKGVIKPKFVEASACKGGCIGGPAMGNTYGIAARQKRLSKFLHQDIEEVDPKKKQTIDFSLKKEHQPEKFAYKMPSEKEIRAILALSGKYSPEDEKNCGGCGYPTCREKAIAVFNGLANPEMCVPYMREKAESLSHAVVDCSLNGIIIVDEDMIIQEFNPAANKMFNRKGIKAKGKHIRTFIDPQDFEYVLKTGEMIVDKNKKYEQYDIVTKESIYPLTKYGVIMALITNITEEEERKDSIDKIKHEALDKASRVINKHMKVAQEIAGLLGESTAETKVSLLELIEIMNKEEGRG